MGGGIDRDPETISESIFLYKNTNQPTAFYWEQCCALCRFEFQIGLSAIDQAICAKTLQATSGTLSTITLACD